MFVYRDGAQTIRHANIDTLTESRDNCHEIMWGMRRMVIDYDGPAGSGRIFEIIERSRKFGKIVVFEMSDDKKDSCHIILTEHVLSPDECKRFAALHYPECDQGIYTQLHSIRLPCSTKNGLRPKYITDGDYSYGPECLAQVDMFPFRTWREYRDSKPAPPITNVATSWQSIMLYGYFEPDGDYAYTRLKPSYCSICGRVHDSDRIYVIDDEVGCFKKKGRMPVALYAKHLDKQPVISEV